jgi:hypothetical protein
MGLSYFHSIYYVKLRIFEARRLNDCLQIIFRKRIFQVFCCKINNQGL